MNVQHNTDKLKKILRSVRLGQGSFDFSIAKCNSSHSRDKLIKQLQEESDIPIKIISLDKKETQLHRKIIEFSEIEPIQVLVIYGFEMVENLEALWTNANLIREEFRKNYPFPMIWWLMENEFQQFMRIAPDFFSWATVDEFMVNSENLISTLQELTDTAFEKWEKLGATWQGLTWKPMDEESLDFQFAWKELQDRNIKIESNLEASSLFLLGRLQKERKEERRYCEDSLAIWRQQQNSSQESILRQGIALFYLGYWWQNEADKNRESADLANRKAATYMQSSLELWKKINREDIASNFINHTGELIIACKQWDLLEEFIEKSKKLHLLYKNIVWQAHDIGFLEAELAIQEKNWEKVKLLTIDALELLRKNSAEEDLFVWVNTSHGRRYWLSLALAEKFLQNGENAIGCLNEATKKENIHYAIPSYLETLAVAETIYSEIKDYCKSFQTLNQRQIIEYQYGYRAFLGIGRLQPKQGILTLEITASKRSKDIENIITRIKGDQYKLIILYGQSGVGKSSLIDAGLIPILQETRVNTKIVMPILVRCYQSWKEDISRALQVDNSEESILKNIKQKSKENQLIVFIFDQFEEFCLVNNLESRVSFYHFFKNCLDVPYVKLLFSLRDDCLHHLLEWTRHIENHPLIENLLHSKHLCYLSNFSVEETKNIFKRLTEQTHFQLESQLIDVIVHELAEESELGEVRPIELQIVGAQLQAQNISTLHEYKKISLTTNKNVVFNCKKNILVSNYINNILEKCGEENQIIAELIVYYLTDKSDIRPLRTRDHLLDDLYSVGFTKKRLFDPISTKSFDEILSILESSGLVVVNSGRYQLVHDYLVKPIREEQEPKKEQIIQQLDKDRQHLLAEFRELQIQIDEAKQKTIVIEKQALAIRTWIEVVAGSLIQWSPLGGICGIILSFLLRQDWSMAFAMFPVMIVTVIWAAYCKAFMTRLQTIYQAEGTRHAIILQKAVDSITEAVKWSLAGTDKNYLRCQGYVCRDYQVEGMSQTFIPQLEEVFVPLELSEAVGWGSNRSSVLVPAGLQWDRDLEKRLRNPDGSSIWDLLQVAEKNPTYRRLLIKAWGGSGKTTLLRYLTYSYTHNKLRRGVTPRLPVFLRLRTCQETLETNSPPDLATLIEKHHIPNLPEGDALKLPTAWAKEHLHQGKMLILWDGFDEIRSDRRQVISQWIGAQMNAYPQTIFILTTRPTAFEDYISEHLFTATVFVKPFNRDQIERFVTRWYLCQEKNARGGRNTPADRAVIQAEAQARSANLFSQLDPEIRPELADLAKNPLLLNMIAILHRFYPSDELPQRRTELYRGILELQLGSRPLFRNIEMPLSAKESQKVLQRLALYMVQEKEDSKIEEKLLLRKLAGYLQTAEEPIDPREFTKKIEDVSEIIVKNDDRYEFAHLSFQGYLAAMEIQQTQQEDLLLQNWDKAWWKETILLYTTLLKNPSPFIRRLIAIGTKEAEELAFECLKETLRKVEPGLERDFSELIVNTQDDHSQTSNSKFKI